MNRIQITLLLIFLIFVIPRSIHAQTNDPHVLIKSQQDIFQNETEIWKEKPFIKVDSVALEDHGIFYPHALTANENDQVAIMAWDDREVVLFNLKDLHNPERLNTRRGRGPREYESPFDMFLAQDKLWISDIGLRKIDVWDIDEKRMDHTFSVNNRFIKPDQISACDNEEDTYSLFVLSTQYGFGFNDQEGIMHKYKFQNGKLNLTNTFQPLSNDHERYPYVITGDIACSENELYYSADYSGTIRNYNESGQLDYYRTGVNSDTDEPIFFYRENGNTIRNRDAIRINGNLFVINERLYIERSRNSDADIHSLDVYEKQSGKYLHSIKLPALTKEIALTTEFLVAIEFRGNDGYDLKLYRWDSDKF